jgi:HAMP domain-containing protein
METFAELLATGESSYLVLAVVAFAAAILLGIAAVQLRPRTRRRRAA